MLNLFKTQSNDEIFNISTEIKEDDDVVLINNDLPSIIQEDVLNDYSHERQFNDSILEDNNDGLKTNNNTYVISIDNIPFFHLKSDDSDEEDIFIINSLEKIAKSIIEKLDTDSENIYFTNYDIRFHNGNELVISYIWDFFGFFKYHQHIHTIKADVVSNFLEFF
jgi:hypothetical protein